MIFLSPSIDSAILQIDFSVGSTPWALGQQSTS